MNLIPPAYNFIKKEIPAQVCIPAYHLQATVSENYKIKLYRIKMIINKL